MKKTTLTLLDLRANTLTDKSQKFKVISIKNSIEWRVDQYLSEEEVREIAYERDNTDVIIKGGK